MAAIAGLRGTGDWGTDERPKNFRDMILRLRPNGTAPITALMDKMGKQAVNDPEFNWWEETLSIVSLTVNGTIAAGITALVVTEGALALSPGDILMVENGFDATFTNELVKVTAVASDTAVTISRGYAGSTAATITTAWKLIRVGTAFEEGSASPSSNSLNPTKFNNYCEIFKKTFNVTETAAATYARTGDTVKNDKMRQAFAHSVDMEMACIFGKAAEATGAGGKPERTTGGLIEFAAAASRVTVGVAMVGAAGMNTFFDAVFDVFDYTGDGETGGDERIVFCGSSALVALNKACVAAGTRFYDDVVKVYGMNFIRMVTPHGTLYFKSHPLLSRATYHTKTAIVLDPPGVKYRYLRDTKSKDNVQGNDEDQKKGQWLTEAGYEFNHMVTMKVLANMTYAAA